MIARKRLDIRWRDLALGRVLYLPVYAALPVPERQRLAGLVLAGLQR